MGSEESVCQQREIHAWKSYTEAERIALYRRVWGPSWNPSSMGTTPGGRSHRDELIHQHLIVVEMIVGALLRAGQSPAIQRDDLLQIGYEELIRTIDRPANGTLALDKRIARNCKTAMIRFIEDERREWRYVHQGRKKVLRDTRAGIGLPASKAAARPAESAAREAADEFIFPDWLCGSVSVYRRRPGHLLDELQGCDLPEELAEIAHRVGYQFKPIPERGLRFHMRPILECLRPSPPGRRGAAKAATSTAGA
jgi:hypothetical protein